MAQQGGHAQRGGVCVLIVPGHEAKQPLATVPHDIPKVVGCAGGAVPMCCSGIQRQCGVKGQCQRSDSCPVHTRSTAGITGELGLGVPRRPGVRFRAIALTAVILTTGTWGRQRTGNIKREDEPGRFKNRHHLNSAFTKSWSAALP